MAFQKRPPLPEPTSYSDPLGLEDWHLAEVTDPQPENRAAPIQTGLSEEEDAGRFLHHQFGDLLFCINCERSYRAELVWCPACEQKLYPPTTPVLRSKRKVR
jgi:hypothetical protein